jgi:chromosome segregation ATPase
MSINGSTPFRGLIRPKISTMPRQKTEATTYLSIYKLSVEKKRLEDELQHLESRKAQIEQRLTTLHQDIAALKASVPEGQPPQPPSIQQALKDQGFETLFLEY